MFILKIGGGKDINWDYIAQDLKTVSEKFIVVHGANYKMKEICQKINLPEKIVTSPSGFSSRFTNQEVIDAMLMTYSGLTNKRIVEVFQKNDLNALGLSGLDGRLIVGQRKKTILAKENGKTKALHGSYTGKVTSVNTALLDTLLEQDYVPIISTPIISDENEIINADNDRLVANIAKAIKIKTVFSLFEAPGLLEDTANEDSVINKISRSETEKFIAKVPGRMKMKIMGAQEAFNHGVEKIYWGDGRIEKPITRLLQGQGTLIEG